MRASVVLPLHTHELYHQQNHRRLSLIYIFFNTPADPSSLLKQQHTPLMPKPRKVWAGLLILCQLPHNFRPPKTVSRYTKPKPNYI